MQRWPTNKAFFWETAPFFRLLLPVVIGIAGYQWLHQYSAQLLTPFSIVLIVSFIAFIVTALIKGTSSVINASRTLFLFITLGVAAWMFCYFNDIQNNQRWFGYTINDTKAYAVRISSTPVLKERTTKLEVNVLFALQDGKAAAVTGKALVYVYRDSLPLAYQQGDTIIIPNKWKPITNSGNPFEFDYAGYSARNNLYYVQFIAPAQVHLYSSGTSADRSLTEQAHNWCMQQLQHFLPDSAAMGLMQAMLLGDEANLDNHLLQAYAETGIVHIIAISGGNVAIFFIVIAFLLSWLKNKKYTWVKYFIALPLVWFYVLMAGAPPSAIRAAIMFSILALGFALQKRQNSLNFLLAAAFILLCAEPMWLFAVGFQLSFIAVLSLVLFYAPIYKLYTPTNVVAKGLWSTVVASMAAEILVAPLVIYYFHLFPLLFLVANVLAYLFMGLVLILGMSVITLSIVPPIAKLLGLATITIVTFFDNIVYILQTLNPTSFRYLYLQPLELALLYIIIAGIAVFILQKNKRGLFTGVTALCLLLVSFCINQWKASHHQKLVVYNASGTNHIEFINGKEFIVLRTDSGFTGNKRKYVTEPAHTAWHAWRSGTYVPSDRFLLSGKTVLLLDSFKTGSYHKTPVDYLVITHHLSTPPQQIIETFNPKLIVLSSAIHKNEAVKWDKITRIYHIQLHTVAHDGAFIAE